MQFIVRQHHSKQCLLFMGICSLAVAAWMNGMHTAGSKESTDSEVQQRRTVYADNTAVCATSVRERRGYHQETAYVTSSECEMNRPHDNRPQATVPAGTPQLVCF